MSRVSTAGSRLVPPARWSTVATVVGLCGAGVVVLALGLHGVHGAVGLDDLVDPVVAVTDPSGRRLLRGVVGLGRPSVVSVFVLVLAALGALARRWDGAALALLGPGVSAVVGTLILEPVVGRTVEGSGPGFPSGHATAATALGVVVVVLVAGCSPVRAPAVLTALVGGAVAAASAVCVSLISLQLHHATDVAGGLLVATGTVLGLALLIDAVTTRRRRG